MTPPTFLFADLVGWTAFTEAEGDERGAELALGFRRRVSQLLDGHHAHEVKSLGDGVMLRADDPRDAVRLALAVVEEEEIPVRVGAHTGSAVEREGDWYGTTVNVAARLCAAAGDGEVLVSEATLGAAGGFDDVELSDQRLHWLRGVREPIAARVASAPVQSAAQAPRCTDRRGRALGWVPARLKEVYSP